MDASPDVLAERVRARRVAIDNDLELLRIRLSAADPRRFDLRQVALGLAPLVAGAVALLLWRRRRRRLRTSRARAITAPVMPLRATRVL